MIRSPRQMLRHVDSALRATDIPNPHPQLAHGCLDNQRAGAIAPSVSTSFFPARQMLAVSEVSRLRPFAATMFVSSPTPQRVSPLAPQQRFPIASIDLTRGDIALPYGIPQYINAATLKALMRARTFDQLLRKTADGWTFVPDDTVIDLNDSSVQFRVGPLTIFS